METAIGKLLYNERYLMRVLFFLIDDGLHECRLVCQFWNQVVMKLPLCLRCTEPGRLPELMTKFPNATSVDFGIWGVTELTSDLIDSLISSKYFGQLKLGIRSLSVFGKGWTDHFLRLRQLRLLHLTVATSVSDVSMFYAGIGQLENLVELVLSLDVVGEGKIFVEPLPQLRHIQDLTLSNGALLVNHRRELMFPSLINLRRLKLHKWKPRNLSLPHILNYIGSYGNSLRELILQTNFGKAESLNWDRLGRLQKLESLTCHQKDLAMTNFFVFLQRIPNLKHLDLKHVPNDLEDWQKVISKSTGLESLIVESVGDCPTAPLVRNLSLLTKLDISGSVGAGIEVMTGLVDLSLRLDGQDSFDILSIKQLTNLERLNLCCPSSYMSSDCLSSLIKLRDLQLYFNKGDTDLLQTISKLPQLTYLSLRTNPRAFDISVLCDINLLNNLVSLKLRCGGHLNPCDYIRPNSLNRLKFVEIETNDISVNIREKLEGRFPCLREMLLTRDPLSALLVHYHS